MHIRDTTTRICRKLTARKKTFFIIGAVLLCMYGTTGVIAHTSLLQYTTLLSVITYDRNGIPLVVAENTKGHYVYPLTKLPEQFVDTLLQKEDRYFYMHMGVNPLSTLRALIHFIRYGSANGASTITQQLAKNILETESDRTLFNKFKESIIAVSLELHTTKKEILLMYANTVFLGNQIQGFETGSHVYFNKPLAETSLSEQAVLLATLSHPSTRNPWREENTAYAEALYNRLKDTSTNPFYPPPVSKKYALQHPSSFELTSASITCERSCITTLDAPLTEAFREILARHLTREYDRGARNGAIVVLNAQNEELIAIVGTPNTSKQQDGGQINMALEPRPIGSTIKPFIYLSGFTNGLRPYTKVDDREYKYSIGTGFSLYPKNFDGRYRGEVTLHEALSNSLNVPSVKVLEYIGLGPFYKFLGDTLQFTPIQPFDSYQYGIALGGLEMDLLTLTHYFSVFPRMGTIAPLRVFMDGTKTPASLPAQSHIRKTTTVSEPQYTELVHAIISDRLTGVEQFGLKSNLNLTIPSYGVKTGTSRDFHDSWVVGYTNDYIVGVWVGNSENEALSQVTGQSGAGAIWHDVMEYLAETPYYTKKPILLNHIARIPIKNSLEWGLPDDIVDDHMNLLTEARFVTSPHAGDTFEYAVDTVVPFASRIPVTWSANGITLRENATSTRFTPPHAGSYEIRALDVSTGNSEYLHITVTIPQ